MSRDEKIRVVLETVLSLAAGERVLVVTDEVKGPIGDLFLRAARLITDAVDIYRLEESNRPLTEIAVALMEKLAGVDVYLNVFDARPEETPFRIKLLKAQHAQGGRVGHAPGITREMVETGAMTADYRQLQRDADLLMAVLTGACSARLTTSLGTDITLNIEGRGFLTDVTIGPGGFGNLPAGEVFCGPVEDGAHGTLVVDAAIGGLQHGDDPVTLTVKAGRVEDVACDDAALLARLLPLLDVDGEARMVGELGIGLNPQADPGSNMLEAEKAGGTVHVAFGNNSEMPGGQNHSQTHRDFLMRDATLDITYRDGTLRRILDAGKVVAGKVVA